MRLQIRKFLCLTNLNNINANLTSPLLKGLTIAIKGPELWLMVLITVGNEWEAIKSFKTFCPQIDVLILRKMDHTHGGSFQLPVSIGYPP